MSLTLSIQNLDSLANGLPTRITLDQRGAVIGRSPTSDWCLPDPRNHVSSRHCEIDYRDGGYVLADVSTNGTFVNADTSRLATPRRLLNGDRILIGHYEIGVILEGADAPAPVVETVSAAPEWNGWDSHGGGRPAGVDPSSWDKPKPASAISGQGAMSQNWTPPTVSGSSGGGWAPPAPAASVPKPAASDAGWASSVPVAAAPAEPSGGGWGPSTGATSLPPAAAPDSDWAPSSDGSSTWGVPVNESAPASDWSSSAGGGSAAEDVWGKLAESNVVDWARGGFGAAAPTPKPADPLGLSRKPAESLPSAAPAAPASFASAPAAASPAPSPARAGGDGSLVSLLAAAGIDPAKMTMGENETLGAAGGLLRRLVSGLVVMLEARARAKAQMGAQATGLEFDGNNPLKFARTPEGALAQLLNPPERGFMGTDKAVEDAFRDLQSHQIATLKAMQGALRATLDRFSPTSIKSRAEQKGVLGRILPGARDAALWQAYEREFGGVAQGSDEAFMEVFGREFRKAYEEAARRPL